MSTPITTLPAPIIELELSLLPEPSSKRLLDLLIIAALTPLLLPAILLLACLIKLTSRGPLFYGHTRIGQAGRTFTAWKFRTMVKDAEAALERHLFDNPDWAEEWRRHHKLRRDPRITAIGGFLRRFSLDELPQLLNVVKGEMSLIGPRPIVAQEIARYGCSFRLYCQVKPGITGLWQVSGRNNTTYDQRVSFDQYYVRNRSVTLDLYILKQTLRAVLSGDGAY